MRLVVQTMFKFQLYLESSSLHSLMSLLLVTFAMGSVHNGQAHHPVVSRWFVSQLLPIWPEPWMLTSVAPCFLTFPSCLFRAVPCLPCPAQPCLAFPHTSALSFAWGVCWYGKQFVSQVQLRLTLQGGMQDELGPPALAFVKTVCAVLALDSAVEDQVAVLRRNLLKLVHVREFASASEFHVGLCSPVLHLTAHVCTFGSTIQVLCTPMVHALPEPCIVVGQDCKAHYMLTQPSCPHNYMSDPRHRGRPCGQSWFSSDNERSPAVSSVTQKHQNRDSQH